ncbi:MAG: cyclic nucleotide-binding domain-containing protein [Candidatus Xenobiia bacterium LiM19]
MIDQIEKVETMKKSAVFADLPIEDIVIIADILLELEYPEGQIIFREGEPGDKMYIIVSGQVIIQKGEGDAIEMTLTLGSGECFGEMAILDGLPRSASVKVTKPANLLAIEREDFRELLRVYPEISLNVIQILSGRLRSASSNTIKNIKEQL